MLEVLIQGIWIIATMMIFICGIYFSFKLEFIQLSFYKMIDAIKTKKKDKDGISLFESFAISLAGRIGVGSLAGIALAIYLGGPGVIFWIWITSFFCSTNAFAESVLAVVFRKRDFGNIYRGGPFYYIADGLGHKRLAKLYAFIILIAYIGGFMTIQINTVTKGITQLFTINPLIVGVIISILVSITIFGGVKKIASVNSKLVTFMTIFYFIICIYIIGKNNALIPPILTDILNGALNFKAFGIGILSTLLIGMQKGIFSSEVGLGTGAIATATADSDVPAKNGIVQIFEIHFENLLIATITGFVICMSNYKGIIINDPNGIEITLNAFENHIGDLGPIFIAIITALFGIATVLTGYYYGESSLRFLKKTKKIDIILLKIITVIVLIASSITSSELLWNMIDILVGLIAIINIYAIFSLRSIVIEEYKFFKGSKRLLRK